MEKIKHNIEKLSSKDPIPQHILLTADFTLEELNKNPEKEDLEAIREALGTYLPDEDFDADQIKYLWKKFESIPNKGHKIEDHDKISLARAIYVYENFLEARPEGKDRFSLDEAIKNFIIQEGIETEFSLEAKKLFSEAKKYSEKMGKKLFPNDFNFLMKKTNYGEKDTESIINYYKDLRKTFRPINLENEKELAMFSKALELNKIKGPYQSIKVQHIGVDTRQNVMMFLTAPEKPQKRAQSK